MRQPPDVTSSPPALVRALGALVSALNVCAAVAGIALTLLVISSAVMRYLVGAPLKFSDELVGLLFLTLSFLALPLGLFHGRHVTLDIFTRRLRPAPAALAAAGASVLFVAFAAVFVWQAWEFAMFSRLIDARSELGSLVLWPWMLMMAVTFAIALLVALVQLVDAVRRLGGAEPWMPLPKPEAGP